MTGHSKGLDSHGEEGVVSWQISPRGQVKFGKRSDMNKDSFRGEMGKEGIKITFRNKMNFC